MTEAQRFFKNRAGIERDIQNQKRSREISHTHVKIDSPDLLFIDGKARNEKHLREILAVDQPEARSLDLLDNRFTVRANVT